MLLLPRLVFVLFLVASISINKKQLATFLAGRRRRGTLHCYLGIIATELRVVVQVHEIRPVRLSYFSAIKQCFPLTAFQHKHQHKPNIQCTGESQSLLASFPKHFGIPSLGYTVSIFYSYHTSLFSQALCRARVY